MKLTVENIIHHLGKTGQGTPRDNTAKKLGITPSALSMMKKRGHISMEIALLCHLSKDIPYTFQPNDYGINANLMNLNLKKTQGLNTYDQSTRNHRAS